MDPLSVRFVENAVVYPTIRVASHPGKLLMGVYDGHGAYVDDTALNRRSGEQGAPVPRDLFPVVTDSEPPEAIYAGPLYFHFGHFLLESLARAWYAGRHPDLPFVWAGQHTWQTTGLRRWQLEILDILGIGNPTRITADPTRYERLHVPDIGYRYDDWLHPEHAAFLGRYRGPAQVRGHRLWISRSSIASDVRDLNAEPTERRLARAGWTIAHPESLSIRAQLDLLCRAETVAGEEGSAFHTLALLADVASKKFHILRRHGREHANMHTVGDARAVDQTFHSLSRQAVVRAEGRVVSKVTPNASEILDILQVPVPPAPDPSPEQGPVDPALERVVTDLEPRRFLDVGCGDVRLVVGSAASTRVAVSTRFDVDPRSYAASPVDFYELGFEQYVDLFHGHRRPFDVIRLTGADLGQLVASFRTSRRVAHEATTWVLGSGELGARAALAIGSTCPGFTARRLVVLGSTVYVVRPAPEQPADESAVARLSSAEVARRASRLRRSGVRRLRARDGDGDGAPRAQ